MQLNEFMQFLCMSLLDPGLALENKRSSQIMACWE